MACCWTNSKKWSPDRLRLLLHVGDFDGEAAATAAVDASHVSCKGRACKLTISALDGARSLDEVRVRLGGLAPPAGTSAESLARVASIVVDTVVCIAHSPWTVANNQRPAHAHRAQNRKQGPIVGGP